MPSANAPLTKQALAGFKWSTLSTIVQGVCQFAIFTTLAHLLGPAEFGIVGMATIFTNFIERVGFLGIGQALVQREHLTEAHVRCGFVLCLLFGALFFAVLYLLAPWLSVFFDEPRLSAVLRVISLSFVLACIAEVPMSLLQRELKFKKLLVVTNAGYLIGNGVFGITLALLGFGYWSLVVAIVVGRIARLIIAFNMCPQRISLDFTRRDVADLLHVGTGFSLGRMTNYVALVGDNFVTGKILGAQALGLYSRAYQLMTAPATYFGQILERVFFAALSQRQSEREKVAKYFLYGMELCLIVSVTGGVLLFAAAPEVVIVLFGRQWLEAVPAVQILAFGVIARNCYKNSDTVIRALGAVYRLAVRQTIYAVAVVLGAIAGSRWGIEGIAIAVMVAVYLNYLIVSVLCLRLLDMSWAVFLWAHVPALVLGACQFAVVLPLLAVCRQHGVAPFLTLVAVCGALGIVSLFGLLVCPKSLRPRVFVWLGRNLPFEKLGRIGRFARQSLLRDAAEPSPAGQGAEQHA